MRVLGVGQCTLDFLGVIEHFVEPDSQIELDQFSIQGGGPAATALVALARWGQPTAFLGKVGSDSRGQEILATLRGEGVDVSRMICEQGAVSPSAFIFVEEKTRHTKRYYTHGSVSPLTIEEISPDALDDVSTLYVDGTLPELQVELMRRARARGIRTILDADRLLPQIQQLVTCADVVVASERFISRLTGEGGLENMARALLARGPWRVVITLGDEGAVAMDASELTLHRSPAHPVEVLDTTGAGDVFHGALTLSMLRGWPLDYALRLSNAAAGVSCTSLGGRSRIPSLQELWELVGEPEPSR